MGDGIAEFDGTATDRRCWEGKKWVGTIAITVNKPERERYAPGRYLRTEEMMARRVLSLCSVAVGAALMGAYCAQAQSPVPNLSGSYRCVSDTRPCQSPSFTVSQSKGKLNVKSEQGDVATGEVTSNGSVSVAAPWNMIGTILADQRTIQWAAGTRWQKD